MEDRERLIQEDYVDTEHGPWKVLLCCICLNLASWKQVEVAMRKLLELYPKPCDIDLMPRTYLEGCKIYDSIYEVMKPLGFGKRRTGYVLDVTHDYIRLRAALGDRYELFDVERFRGCGPYAVDAWTLLVLKRPCAPKDRRLRRYAVEHQMLVNERSGCALNVLKTA